MRVSSRLAVVSGAVAVWLVVAQAAAGDHCPGLPPMAVVRSDSAQIAVVRVTDAHPGEAHDDGRWSFEPIEIWKGDLPRRFELAGMELGCQFPTDAVPGDRFVAGFRVDWDGNANGAYWELAADDSVTIGYGASRRVLTLADFRAELMGQGGPDTSTEPAVQPSRPGTDLLLLLLAGLGVWLTRRRIGDKAADGASPQA